MKHISKTRLTLQEEYNATATSQYEYGSDEFEAELLAITDEHWEIESDIEKGDIKEYGVPTIADLEEILEKIAAYKASGGTWYHSTVLQLSRKLLEENMVYLSGDENETLSEDSESFKKYQELMKKMNEENYVKVYPDDDKNHSKDAIGGVFSYHTTGESAYMPG